MTGEETKKRQIARITYLREHPEVWSMGHAELVRHMKDKGLLARSTYYLDVNIKQMLALAGATCSNS